MMFPTLRTATIGLLVAGAAPLFAQAAAPPAPPAAPVVPAVPGHHAMRGGMYGGGMQGGGMWRGMTEAGRSTMREAMRAGGDPRSDHQSVKAARNRMLTVLDAESLDTGALKRAMEDERRAAEAGRDKRHAAMLSGFAKLTTADRKAFVANARAMKDRMEVRVIRMKQRGPGGPGNDTPPPPVM